MLKGCISARKRPSFRLKPVIFSLLDTLDFDLENV